MTLRFVDVRGEATWPQGGTPVTLPTAVLPDVIYVELAEGERVVTVETIRDTFGYERARVWVEVPE